MKTEELILVALAGVAVWMVMRSRRGAAGARGLSSGLSQKVDSFGAAGGVLWTDTEAAYAGTWTSAGPLDLNTYNGQIYD